MASLLLLLLLLQQLLLLLLLLQPALVLLKTARVVPDGGTCSLFGRFACPPT
jgi:hypothetical protein